MDSAELDVARARASVLEFERDEARGRAVALAIEFRLALQQGLCAAPSTGASPSPCVRSAALAALPEGAVAAALREEAMEAVDSQRSSSAVAAECVATLAPERERDALIEALRTSVAELQGERDALEADLVAAAHGRSAFTFGILASALSAAAPHGDGRSIFGAEASFSLATASTSSFTFGSSADARPSPPRRVLRTVKKGNAALACDAPVRTFAIGGRGEKKLKKKPTAKQRRAKSSARQKKKTDRPSPEKSDASGPFKTGWQLGLDGAVVAYRTPAAEDGSATSSRARRVIAGYGPHWKTWPEAHWPATLGFLESLPHRAFCRAVVAAEVERAGIMVLDSALIDVSGLGQADSARVVSFLDRHDAATMMSLSRRHAVMVVRDWNKWESNDGFSATDARSLSATTRSLTTRGAQRSFLAWRSAMHRAHSALRPRLFSEGMKRIALSLGAVARVATALVDSLADASMAELAEAGAMRRAEETRVASLSRRNSAFRTALTNSYDGVCDKFYDGVRGEIAHGSLVREASHKICAALDRLVAWCGRARRADFGACGVGLEALVDDVFLRARMDQLQLVTGQKAELEMALLCGVPEEVGRRALARANSAEQLRAGSGDGSGDDDNDNIRGSCGTGKESSGILLWPSAVALIDALEGSSVRLSPLVSSRLELGLGLRV